MRAATLLDDRTDELEALVRDGRWTEACLCYERSLEPRLKQDDAYRLLYAVALIRSVRVNSGLNLLTPEVVRHPDARPALRRRVVPWLVAEKRLDAAIEVLGQLLQAEPDSVEDRRLRGSLLGRTRRFSAAIEDALRVVELRPDDLDAQAAYLQLLLQDGQVATAADYARVIGKRAVDNVRLARIALLCISRARLCEEAATLAEAVEASWPIDAEAVTAVVRAYWEAGRTDQAIRTGERCLAAGSDSPKLRQLLGHVYRSTMRTDGNARALQHLLQASQHLPDDANTALLLGEAMLRSGRAAEAVPPLGKACKRFPNSANARALLARALKQDGQHADAAREFRRLIELQPASHGWHRYAAGALSQAGQVAEAAALYDRFTARRAKALPADFESGLQQLWERADSVAIPHARFEWAWHLRHDRDADADEWQRAARWGHLADHYLLDWLECRDDQVHQAMARLADLTEAEQTLSAVDTSRGLVIASAHVGPMYAGPLALELLGLRSKWLASTPSVARTAYARSLISTSDQGGTEVARKVMSSLGSGDAVVIAIDGAANLSAPRIRFEGQEITYSSFAARMAHRLSIPSMFAAPRWDGGQIHFTLERMPDPHRGESAEEHAERWQAAYLQSLRNFLGGAPENLRLSGGVWRYIRSPNESGATAEADD